MKAQLLRFLVALFALSLFVAACGDSSDSSQSSDDDTSASDDGGGDDDGSSDDDSSDDDSSDDDSSDDDSSDGDSSDDSSDDDSSDDDSSDDTSADDGDGDDGGGSDGNEVSYGIVEPSWIDSFNVQDSEGFEVARLLYDGLTALAPDLSAAPAVAESWETEDNQVWTFNLRDDVTFHDGTPVTAESFIRAFNFAANPDNLSDVAYQGSAIAGIEGWAEVEGGEATEVSGAVAIDDTTLEITLATPYPLLPKAMAHPVFSPRPEGDVDPDAPIGNGPYMMDGVWEHDTQIRVVRNDSYYGDAGGPDAILFRIFDSIDTMYLEVQAGGLDVGDVPPEQIESAASEFGDRFIQLDIGSYNYLGFPTQIEPFDNPDIRRALSLAIDRQGIVDAIFAGTRAPANGFAPPLAPGAVGECANTEFDPDLAKELYDAAGGIDGPITVFFNSGGGHEEWIEAVANFWKQNLGVEEVEFVGQEFSPYLDVLQSEEGVTGPYRLGWLWDLPSAENFLSPLFLSTSGDNFSLYESADFDAAIDDFRAAEDEEAGFPALADAQNVLCEDMPVAPMFFGTAQKVFGENVSNVNYTVFGYTELESVEVG